ncbi:efflux RND transporter periplasmic adaptor subunit [Catenovulum sp. 2E275]|uniref:efflux RND transporter periplasmic adaptor subunit n=1 Tax=Catenovulum sp. 2E275 TaxID=2980497 RepID=UPI0021D309B8|nr:efflux RND transporter periplasmic adaptor subunit [Catenovulum sp. 2E275]MCU4674089.1 efflux RND transporter periplasmic adaptor subunit [Catenovulum sp. 2E275]
MKKRTFILMAIVLVSSFGLWSFFQTQNRINAQELAQPAQAKQVDSLTLDLQSIEQTQFISGRVVASRYADIRPQVDGIIINRLFDEGAYIEKGQQLYQIDDAKYKARLTSANAGLNSAKADFEALQTRMKRYRELIKAKAISQQEFENTQAQLLQAQANVELANAQVELAQVELDYTKVFAPISGHIGRSFVTEGALVIANQTQALARLTQLNPAFVDLQESRNKSLKLQQILFNSQQNVPFSVDFTDETGVVSRSGEIKFSELNIEQSTDSVTFRGELDNPDFKLLPGAFVNASINLGEQAVILLPHKAAIRNALGELEVWLIDQNNQAFVKTIQAQSSYQDNWIIEQGLTAGDKIVLRGYQKLKSGDLVEDQNNQPKID